MPWPTLAQKSISDFPFNTCTKLKVHSVLLELGHFEQGGVAGGSLKSNCVSFRGWRKTLWMQQLNVLHKVKGGSRFSAVRSEFKDEEEAVNQVSSCGLISST